MQLTADFVRNNSGFVMTHYKGTQYVALGLGRHTETGEELLTYRAIVTDPTGPHSQLWVRPLDQCIDVVQHEGQTVPRFSIEEQNNDPTNHSDRSNA